MTYQEAFDKVVKHLYAQKRQAINYTGSCQYRVSSGRKCAIGALIPDEEYKSSMEGCSISYLDTIGRFPESLKGFSMDFLSRLQKVHDDVNNLGVNGPTENMASALLNIAKDFKLEYTAP